LADGILEEYATLVNPGRDVGPTRVHGIRASDLVGAPTFVEIAGAVAARLQGAVVVAHNARFDTGFLLSEFGRVGIDMPPLPTVCTLALAKRVRPDLASRKLAHCCEDAGIAYEGGTHAALNDARATAHLLAAYVAVALGSGLITLEALGCRPTAFPPVWCDLPPTGRCVVRPSERLAEERAYLARLVEKLPPTPFDDPDEAAYLELLDRVLEDRRVTTDEADVLLQTATSWGLSRAAVFEAHHKYLGSLVATALADGEVTSTERNDLEGVCELLGLHRAALEAFLSGAPPHGGPITSAAPATLSSPQKPDQLKGLTVCFTGEFMGQLGGQVITRDLAERLAMEAGLFVRKSVTKQLDLLVAADPATQSGKARKARGYGTRILGEADFWSAIGIKAEC